MPLALGASRAPSASAHAEPQGFSNFPQLPPPELEIETIMDLASVLPQSKRDFRGPNAGVSCHLHSTRQPVRAFSASASLPSSGLPFGWNRGCWSMGSHADAEACPGLFIPPSETRAHSAGQHDSPC